MTGKVHKLTVRDFLLMTTANAKSCEGIYDKRSREQTGSANDGHIDETQPEWNETAYVWFVLLFGVYQTLSHRLE